MAAQASLQHPTAQPSAPKAPSIKTGMPSATLAEDRMRRIAICVGIFVVLTSSLLPFSHYFLSSAHSQSLLPQKLGFEGGPAFTSLRSKNGTFHVTEAYSARPTLIYILHYLPAMAWTVIAPLQFNASLRQSRPGLHRYLGMVYFLLSLTLGATGFYMIATRFTYSHANRWHLHGGVLPTFDVALTFVDVIFTGSLIQAYRSIWQRRIADHRAWVIVHTCIGMTVHYQRVVMYSMFAMARLLSLCGLSIPSSPKAWELEMTAFTLTGYAGFALAAASAAWALAPIWKTTPWHKWANPKVTT